MMWIPLLVVLTSSVCGMFAVKRTLYQAEENEDITIRWDSNTKTDMSRTILSLSISSLQDGCSVTKTPMREGRVRLHLSRVRTDDSGNYWCDLAANYDELLRRWVLKTTGKPTQRDEDTCCMSVCAAVVQDGHVTAITEQKTLTDS
ncbi:hypothetical protein L3Q82_016649 [Scortum barcoo]|uniref:Uncharacterized protein n=1 Tax=Scortum barcoo TaxID=214431 RepID=A0ACB8X8S5_9TELE|nr:hypothetical protein L3Q82_016649 [Scortum barcoo]